MLERVARHAQAYLDSLPERPVGIPVEPGVLRESLAIPLPTLPAGLTMRDLSVSSDDGYVMMTGRVE